MAKRGPVPQAFSGRTFGGRNTHRGGNPWTVDERVDPSIIPPWLDWLADDAKAFWLTTAPPLHAAGVIHVTDLTGLAMLAMLWADFVEAGKRVDAEGITLTGKRGQVYAHPCVKIQTKAIGLWLAFAKDFGCTPSARQRMGFILPSGAIGDDDADALERFINRPTTIAIRKRK